MQGPKPEHVHMGQLGSRRPAVIRGGCDAARSGMKTPHQVEDSSQVEDYNPGTASEEAPRTVLPVRGLSTVVQSLEIRVLCIKGCDRFTHSRAASTE